MIVYSWRHAANVVCEIPAILPILPILRVLWGMSDCKSVISVSIQRIFRKIIHQGETFWLFESFCDSSIKKIWNHEPRWKRSEMGEARLPAQGRLHQNGGWSMFQLNNLFINVKYFPPVKSSCLFMIAITIFKFNIVCLSFDKRKTALLH